MKPPSKISDEIKKKEEAERKKKEELYSEMIRFIKSASTKNKVTKKFESDYLEVVHFIKELDLNEKLHVSKIKQHYESDRRVKMGLYRPFGKTFFHGENYNPYFGAAVPVEQGIRAIVTEFHQKYERAKSEGVAEKFLVEDSWLGGCIEAKLRAIENFNQLTIDVLIQEGMGTFNKIIGEDPSSNLNLFNGYENAADYIFNYIKTKILNYKGDQKLIDGRMMSQITKAEILEHVKPVFLDIGQKEYILESEAFKKLVYAKCGIKKTKDSWDKETLTIEQIKELGILASAEADDVFNVLKLEMQKIRPLTKENERNLKIAILELGFKSPNKYRRQLQESDLYLSRIEDSNLAQLNSNFKKMGLKNYFLIRQSSMNSEVDDSSNNQPITFVVSYLKEGKIKNVTYLLDSKGIHHKQGDKIGPSHFSNLQALAQLYRDNGYDQIIDKKYKLPMTRPQEFPIKIETQDLNYNVLRSKSSIFKKKESSLKQIKVYNQIGDGYVYEVMSRDKKTVIERESESCGFHALFQALIYLQYSDNEQERNKILNDKRSFDIFVEKCREAITIKQKGGGDITLPTQRDLLEKFMDSKLEVSSKKSIEALEKRQDGLPAITAAQMEISAGADIGSIGFESDLPYIANIYRVYQYLQSGKPFEHSFILALDNTHWITLVLKRNLDGKIEWYGMDSYGNQTKYFEKTKKTLENFMLKIQNLKELKKIYNEFSHTFHRIYQQVFDEKNLLKKETTDKINGLRHEDTSEYLIQKGTLEFNLDATLQIYDFFKNADLLNKEEFRNDVEKLSAMVKFYNEKFESGTSEKLKENMVLLNKDYDVIKNKFKEMNDVLQMASKLSQDNEATNFLKLKSVIQTLKEKNTLYLEKYKNKIKQEKSGTFLGMSLTADTRKKIINSKNLDKRLEELLLTKDKKELNTEKLKDTLEDFLKKDIESLGTFSQKGEVNKMLTETIASIDTIKPKQKL